MSMAPEKSAVSERPLVPALKRGWKRQCPNCGQGAMMDGYLTVRRDCANCGEEFYHHRADDGPAYLTILAVGHIIGPLMLLTFDVFDDPDTLTMVFSFSALCIVLSMYLLPRIKGAFINLQWAKRMHGFGLSDAV